METTEVLRAITSPERTNPKAALAAAVERRDELAPLLLDVLKNDTRRIAEPQDLSSYDGHLYAMYLLAQYREPQALPVIAEFLSVPSVDYDDLLGYVLTEDLPRILASVYSGDDAPLRSVIENDTLDEWVRSAALHTYLVLVNEGKMRREDVLAYVKGLLTHKLARRPSAAFCAAASCAVSLGPHICMEALERAYHEGLVDTDYMGWDEVEEAHALGPDVAMQRLKKYTRGLITDVLKDTAWWRAPRPDESLLTVGTSTDKVRPAAEPRLAPVPGDEYRESALTGAPLRAVDKVYPNDPCPCGSGSKYKKCCGRVS